MVNYRKFHPGDIVLIYGTLRVLERVDKTHLATLDDNNRLELWSYEGEVELITFDNIYLFTDLGFYKDKDLVKLDTEKEEITIFSDGKCEIFLKELNSVNTHNGIYTLNDLQQFYFEITNKELINYA